MLILKHGFIQTFEKFNDFAKIELENCCKSKQLSRRPPTKGVGRSLDHEVCRAGEEAVVEEGRSGVGWPPRLVAVLYPVQLQDVAIGCHDVVHLEGVAREQHELGLQNQKIF